MKMFTAVAFLRKTTAAAASDIFFQQAAPYLVFPNVLLGDGEDSRAGLVRLSQTWGAPAPQGIWYDHLSTLYPDEYAHASILITEEPPPAELQGVWECWTEHLFDPKLKDPLTDLVMSGVFKWMAENKRA